MTAEEYEELEKTKDDPCEDRDDSLNKIVSVLCNLPGKQTDLESTL